MDPVFLHVIQGTSQTSKTKTMRMIDRFVPSISVCRYSFISSRKKARRTEKSQIVSKGEQMV